MDIKAAFGLPFPEAIKFFEAKLQLPTASYTDIFREQYSHTFVVAGAAQDAMVEDFYNAMKKALNDGTGLLVFQKDFDTIVEKYGWSHHGSAGWRSKLIYDTNIRQAYNAGEWQQIASVAHLRPYLQYAHISITNPRVEHQYLDGLILPVDSARWNYIMPQNGYGCQCRVYSLSRMEAQAEWEKAGKTGPDPEPGIEWVEKTIGTTGSNPRTVKVPIITTAKGRCAIDPGFAYNPGKAWLEPYTVPPLTGYDAVLAKRGATLPAGGTPPLPTPTTIKPTVLLPASTPPAAAVEEFLSIFDADMKTGAVFRDVVDQPIAITKRLFVDEAGSLVGVDAAKVESMNLLAMALIEPDEIWWHWEQDNSPAALPDVKGRWRLKRRYLRLFEIEGQAKAAVTAFEFTRTKGWYGETAFVQPVVSDMEAELDSLRVGKLVYSKGKK